MKHTWKRLAAFLPVLLLLIQTARPGAAANLPLATAGETPPPSAQEGETRLTAVDQKGITFDVQVPWEQVRLEPAATEEGEFVRVALSDWPVLAQAGLPALPFQVEQIGAPVGAVLSVKVTTGKAHTLALTAPILPAVTQSVAWGAPGGGIADAQLNFAHLSDPAVYQGSAAYPGELAEITGDGMLRQQRVVGVAVYPLQYHPGEQTLTVYESLRVEVSFSKTSVPARQTRRAEAPAYEALLKESLLNYEAARRWRTDAPDGSAAAAALQAAGVEAAAWTPPAPGWRVKVRADGMYQMSYTDLQNAGLPVDSLDPRTFQLYHLGEQVAIRVEGEADGSFDPAVGATPADRVIFYGQGIQSKYTNDNVYWLTYGQASGLRMAFHDGTPAAAQTPEYFPASLHLEQGKYYLSPAPGDEHLDRWMWDYIYPPSRPSWSPPTITLTAPYAGPAKLTVAMLGYIANTINPDHHARISLNGVQVGDVTWDGLAWKIVELDVPAGVLVAGNNTLTVMSPNDTGVGYDVFYIDWAELAYPSRFSASGDTLAFDYETAGTWQFALTGFSTDKLALYDVTNPAAVVQVTGFSASLAGATYTLRFSDTLAAAGSYVARAGGAYPSVQAIEADTASNLSSTLNGADHITISHGGFMTQAGTLRDFRSAQGLRALRVDVQDVYDEFGYGIAGPQAIHDFLAYAYASWQAPAPSYVVLLGDGHYDPKNYVNTRTSYLPPFLAPVDPWIGETAADNRYVTLVGDDTLPDMMLGRLAVNSPTEAAAFVDKVIAYEQTPVAGDWHGQVLAVADNGDSAGDFAQISDDLLADHLPAEYQAERVYLGVTHADTAAARSAIQAGINAGKLIINYIGHAYNVAWASEGLFQASDVAGLSNGGKLPVILAMTCREGSYHSPLPLSDGQEALAEVVTRAAGKGAVASWSPTGLGVASGHDYLNRGFLDAVFADVVGTVGKATAAGKLDLWMAGGSLDLLDTYLLFGDPAMKIQALPAAAPEAPANLQASPISTTQINLAWSDYSGSETEFRIERSPDGTSNWQQIAQVGANVTTYSSTGLTQDTTYFYRVKAYRSGDGASSSYSNTASARTYAAQPVSLAPGWNLITLALTPITSFDAESLLAAMNAQGTACTEISRWENGGWVTHPLGFPIELFPIEMGEGYFVKCNQAFTWTLSGSRLPSGVAIGLNPGWNLIGAPYPNSGLLAHDILDQIGAQGGECSELMRWVNSGWEAYVPPFPINDYAILPVEGYFAKCSTSSSFTPANP